MKYRIRGGINNQPLLSLFASVDDYMSERDFIQEKLKGRFYLDETGKCRIFPSYTQTAQNISSLCSALEQFRVVWI